MHFGVAPFMETFIVVEFLFVSVAWITTEDAAEGVRNSILVEAWVQIWGDQP